ncbi:MAG TPA: hypothetical protein VNH44_16915 [Micropepsaceae bacterium]|nr:hypothetical protein [Micropepsaceae bacterium]
MAGLSATTADCARIETAGSCGRSRKKLRSNVLIFDRARELFPTKTALQLVEITGCPLRTVESWMEGSVKIPSDALVDLLRSDYGREFLSAVMADATPRWWLQLKAFFGAIDLAVAQRIHRRKMKALLDADFASQIPHAALFQDEDFYGAQPAPPRSMHRPVVRGKAR